MNRPASDLCSLIKYNTKYIGEIKWIIRKLIHNGGDAHNIGLIDLSNHIFEKLQGRTYNLILSNARVEFNITGKYSSIWSNVIRMAIVENSEQQAPAGS